VPDYRAYLPELKSSTLFQDIEDEALLALLEAMRPAIIRIKAGERPVPGDFSTFRILLKSGDSHSIAPRRFKWEMPKFGEPGFLMGESPSLSKFFAARPRPARSPFRPKPPRVDFEALEVSGEMLARHYNASVAPAQSVMLRNLLGILAQKVMDVRRELFLSRDGFDLVKAASAAGPETDGNAV
jgi:hypothetical protein